MQGICFSSVTGILGPVRNEEREDIRLEDNTASAFVTSNRGAEVSKSRQKHLARGMSQSESTPTGTLITGGEHSNLFFKLTIMILSKLVI